MALRLPRAIRCWTKGLAIVHRPVGGNRPTANMASLCGHGKRLKLDAIKLIPTVPRRNIHAAILVIMRPVGKILAILAGRTLRKWVNSLPEDQRVILKAQLRRRSLLAFVGLILIIAIYYATHLERHPITKRLRFVGINAEQFDKVSQFMYETQLELYESSVLPTDHADVKRVTKVVNSLLEANKDMEQVTKKNWKVHVVDEPVANAFVLPAGQIFVFKGMLEVCLNDDQLATILAHEMSHSILGHGLEQLSSESLVDVAMIFAVGLLWFLVPTDSMGLLVYYLLTKAFDVGINLPYSRKLEREADEFGLELAARGCFDIREFVVLWKTLALFNELGPVEFLSTHPTFKHRAENLTKLMPYGSRIREENNCQMLSTVDPRVKFEQLKIFTEDKENKTSRKAFLLNELKRVTQSP